MSTYSDQVRFGRCDKRTCASKRRLPQTPAQIRRSARLRSPSAPRYNFKRHFGLEFNNYFRSALTLRGVRSVFRQLDQAAHTGCPPGNALARARVGIPIDTLEAQKAAVGFEFRRKKLIRSETYNSPYETNGMTMTPPTSFRRGEFSVNYTFVTGISRAGATSASLV